MNTVQNNWRKAFARELVMALSVLALVFLSFAHHPISAQSDDVNFRLTDGSVPVFCGSGPFGQSGSSKSGCDACRITAGIALPDAPCAFGTRIAPDVLVGATVYAEPVLPGRYNLSAPPRAPPFA